MVATADLSSNGVFTTFALLLLVFCIVAILVFVKGAIDPENNLLRRVSSLSLRRGQSQTSTGGLSMRTS